MKLAVDGRCVAGRGVLGESKLEKFDGNTVDIGCEVITLLLIN